MDNYEIGLQNQQAWESALKNQEEEKKQKAERFKKLSLGCLLYALFYTFCLYKNYAGISYPFFVGGTLYCFWRCLKKCGVTAKKDSRYLTAAIAILGSEICLTDSIPIIILNKVVVAALFFILILHSLYSDKEWSVFIYFKAIMCLVFGSIEKIFTPFSDMKCFREKRKSTGNINKELINKILAVAAILICSIPFFCIIVALLCSADSIFGNLFEILFNNLFNSILFDFGFDGNIIGILLTTFAVFGLSYGGIINIGNKEKIQRMTEKLETEWRAYLAISFTSVTALIYVTFSLVQIFGLFLGCMELPSGYTYAEYAREGFFQLLFVCLINVGLVLTVVSLFEKNRVLQIILTVISGCTYIMLASSAYRMILYVASYRLTFLRLFVLWALVMIAVVMAGVIARIYNPDFRLVRYLVVTLTVGYLIFGTAHPDFWIAKYNVETNAVGKVDKGYLYELSADAVPAFKLAGYPCDVSNYEYDGGWDIRTLNLSRLLATIL